MSLIDAILDEKRSGVIGGGSPQNPSWWVQRLFGGAPDSASGMPIDENLALTLSAFWNGVSIIAGAVGFLPWRVYETIKGGRAIRDTHPIDLLLHKRPNPNMSADVFRETLQEHALVWGNGYAEIEFNNAGVPMGLWLLLPNLVTPKVKTNSNGEKVVVYEVQTNGKTETLPSEKVFHVKGLGFDGIKGYSVIGFARESLGMARAVERYGSTFFRNDATPSYALQHPGELGDEAHKHLKKSIEDQHKGVNKSHQFMILEEGMKLQQLGMPAKDAQFISSRKFSVLEVARWLNIPPHMLKDLDKGTFNNVEMMGIEFVTYTLMRWLKRWEGEANYKLFGVDGRRKFFTEFITAALLRGDTKARFDAYRVAISSGWMSRDEARRLENLNSVEALQPFLQPLNMTTVGSSAPEPRANRTEDPGDQTVTIRVETEGNGGSEKFRTLFESTFRRVVTKEVNSLKRIVKKTDTRDEKILEFYTKLVDHIKEVIEPVMRVFGASPQAIEREAEHYVEDSRSQLMSAIESGTEAELLDEWTDSKVVRVVNGFLGRGTV